MKVFGKATRGGAIKKKKSLRREKPNAMNEKVREGKKNEEEHRKGSRRNQG